MSVQEIEQAIAKLSPGEVDEIADWLSSFRESNSSDGNDNNHAVKNGQSLYDAIQAAIGPLPKSSKSYRSSSQNAGEQFTDYLVEKRAKGNL